MAWPGQPTLGLIDLVNVLLLTTRCSLAESSYACFTPVFQKTDYFRLLVLTATCDNEMPVNQALPLCALLISYIVLSRFLSFIRTKLLGRQQDLKLQPGEEKRVLLLSPY